MATYIRRTIVITGQTEWIENARLFALGLGLDASSLVMGRNGTDSIFIAPSGSGEEYENARQEQRAFALLVDYLRARVRLDWVAVTFGREHGPAKISDDCASATSRAAVRWGRT